jgi:VWFA-related protein
MGRTVSVPLSGPPAAFSQLIIDFTCLTSNTIMRTRILLVLLACGLLSAAPRAQQPPPAQPPSPPLTFKVEVNYVEIDASVTDEQGNFVRNLTKDDFQVVEDGKPQTVSAFASVDIPIERADPPLFAKNLIPPDVASNRTPFEGRVFVIVIDDLHINFSRTPRVRAAARQFIERYVGTNDLVAVINTRGRSDAMQDFTSNRLLALNAVDRAMGQGAESSTKAALADYSLNQGTQGIESRINRDFNELERYTNGRNTLDTLRSLAEFVSGMRGRRKAVVLFSEGINYDVVNAIQNRYATEIQSAMNNLIAAATRANASIYAVDPRGVTSGMEDSIDIGSFPTDNSIGVTNLQDELRISQDSLRVMASETGGLAVLNSNDFRTGFSRILDENSSYYVLGYYPSNDKRDGRFRKVQVSVVNKPGLKVRARKGYYASKGKADKPKPPGREGTTAELRDALASPIPVSGLTMAAAATPFRGASPNDAIALALEIDGSPLKFEKKEDGLMHNDIEISLFASDASGKIKDGARDMLALKLRPQTYEIVSKGSIRVVRRLQVPPGKYSLRIGARDGNGGAVGSLVYELDAPDFSKGPLTLSGIAITSASASRVPTTNADPNVNEFKDVLPSPPTATREFPQGDTLAIFSEVYDNLGKAPHRVLMTATVLTDEGKTAFTTSDERRSEELQGASGGYGYAVKIPLAGMAPGRYVLRVDARATTGNEPAVRREVEFRVK